MSVWHLLNGGVVTAPHSLISLHAFCSPSRTPSAPNSHPTSMGSTITNLRGCDLLPRPPLGPFHARHQSPHLRYTVSAQTAF